jgi:hypothetical protein
MGALAEIVRLRTADCRQAAVDLPQLAAGETTDIDPGSAGHVESCLRCQAELAAYRRILRHLRTMRHDLIDPPPGALAQVLAAIEAAADEPHSPATWAVRAAYVGGITVATAAAGAAGVLVWMNRRRIGSLAPTG